MCSPRNGLWPLSLVLSLAAACGTNTASIGIDDPSPDTVGSNELTSSTSKTCAPNTVRATYALGGTILVPWGAMQGYVLVKDESVVGLVATRDAVPCGAAVVETDGVIAPGLIDLHNHVAYNFMGPWTPPRPYANRNQWQNDPAYAAAVKTPYNAVKNAGHLCQAQKYGELRALLGGTTTIQGSIGYACQNGWVRNVESYVFCQDKIRQNVLPILGLTQADATSLITQFDAGTTKAYLVHLAEGVDDASRSEFDHLRTLGLIRKEVVGIHATALTPAQLTEMGQAGMKIVWSPQSNLGLYGATTNVPAALAAGVKVALAPDWTLSGTNNLLAELKVADRINKEQWSGLLTDAQLIEMATTTPAEIAGLGEKIGKVLPGFAADLVVVKKNGKTAHRALIDAQQTDVLLTIVGGQAMYGDTAMLGTLGVTGFDTVQVCGQDRGVLVRDATVANGGAESLADVVTTLTNDGVTPYPLAGACPVAPSQTQLP